ncbi:MAG: FAD-binding oxidoreductase, partial [Proteobacteria bacterium]
PYWLDIPLIEGKKTPPAAEGEILIIGSGLSGISAAYWLQKKGFTDLTLIDHKPKEAASFRNCGHILYGTVESMLALTSLHGEAVAKDLWNLSINICHEVKQTVKSENLDVDYKQDGYLVIGIDESEHQEILKSIELLNKHNFQSEYIPKEKLEKLGFQKTTGARYESGSAQAHPTKFRNALLNLCLSRGLKYHSQIQVKSVEEQNDKVLVKTSTGDLKYEAAVIAANAYSPLLSDFFQKHRLVEPFRGQILCSKPLKTKLPVTYPHSFDHGYEYAIATPDNRLMLGGWRNNTAGEIGTYDITPNPFVEDGLKQFANDHYALAKNEKIEWDYSWAGIMAASKTGFPFIGPTDSQRIFTVSGYTGHGFSWAHGSAKYLADIMAGDPIPDLVARQFNPRLQSH